MDDSLGLHGLGEAITHLNKNDEPPSENLCLLLPKSCSTEKLFHKFTNFSLLKNAIKVNSDLPIFSSFKIPFGSVSFTKLIFF